MLFSIAPRKAAAAKRAFTLIELLVIIAIIAILAAILFPVFAQAREKARQSSCLSNQKQISNAMMMYGQDYDETLFPYRYSSTLGGSITDGVAKGYPNYHFYNQILDTYIKSYNVWRCPSAPDSWVNDCPATSCYGGQNSYSVNKYAFQADASNGFLVGLPFSGMSAPADTIIMVDGTYYDTVARNPQRLRGGPGLDDGALAGYKSRWTCIGNGPLQGAPGPAAGTPAAVAAEGLGKKRHQGFINVIWADGHAKAMDYTKLINDEDDKITKEGKNTQNILWDPWKKGVCTNGTGPCD